MDGKFKVIVAGGGPVGLIAAHALTQAGIDFVILERSQNVILDSGSNLVLTAMGMRALDQLGLMNAMEEVSFPLGKIERVDHKGRDIGEVRLFLYEMQNFGVVPRVLSRYNLTRVLFKSLTSAAQDKIKTNKKVADVATTQEGIQVTCEDGTTYQGSLLIGTDGAHSFVREKMRSLSLQAGLPEVNEEKPFLTTYRAFWLRFCTESLGIKPGTTCECHGSGVTTQLFAGPGTTVVGVYEKLEKPTRERVRYTEADKTSFIERCGHLPLIRGGKLTLGEAFVRRTDSGLVSLEEGVVKQWSWDGRIVLAGDAAHKFTPSTGAGCNNGIIDIVVLANQLHKCLTNSRNPTRSQFDAALRKYQALRMDAVVQNCDTAGLVTASATWQTTIHWLMDRYIMANYYVQKFISLKIAARTARTPGLEFIKYKERFRGKVQWA